MTNPRLVVIIPTYRHPVLLTEALDSVLNQSFDEPFAVIVGSDGCDFVETDIVASAYSLADPRVVYLRKPNGGPSSARNFAIDYALAHYPAMEAVFFLDSDNRLTGSALAVGFAALMAAPEVGWIYSHMDAFGIERNMNYAVPYSPLLHVVHDNVCDTGCFVRRALFDAGVRFDEDARSGFEDWDFWLQALARGFVGKHVLFGFLYRLRPESRYREMNRLRDQVVERLRRRHWPITSGGPLLAWEQAGNPRYLLTYGPGQHEAFVDPTAPRGSISAEQMNADIWGYRTDADSVWNPAFLLFGSQAALDLLARLRLVHNVLWLLERVPAEAMVACVTFQPTPGEIGVEASLSATAPEAALWFCAHERLTEMISAPDVDLRKGIAAKAVFAIQVRGPFATAEISAFSGALTLMLATIGAWRDSEYRDLTAKRWTWRPSLMPSRHSYYAKLCDYLGVSRYTPRLSGGRINVGFVVPIAAFGGAEKVTYALAQQLRRGGGYATHLFVVGAPRMKIVSEFEDAFDTVNFLADSAFPSWGGPSSGFGERFFMPGADALKTPDLMGMLGALDLVVNCQSAPFNAMVGELKRRRIKTATYLHVTDFTAAGRSHGHPFLALGFEHGYDLMITCSRALASELHALGAPREKIIAVPNAAGFRISDETRAQARTARTEPRGARPLRCLYIGRLDRQKGLERLLGVIRKARQESLPLTFRCIGASLIDESYREWLDEGEGLGVSIEAPIYDSAALLEAYAWADVVLLPSRWEGAPLVIPECQQVGTVPLCANVGGVSELIDDGVDGLLVEGVVDEIVVEGFMTALRRLCQDDALRRRIASAAIDRAEGNRWENNFRELVDWIERATADRG